MSDASLLDRLGLPGSFGYLLLALGLVLFLAPYLRGSDFGVVKVPDFDPPVRRALRVVGPLTLLGAVLIHVPVSTATSPPPPEPPEPINPPSGTTPLPLAAGTRVLAPRDGGECLYPATVVTEEQDILRLRFDFGQDGDADPARALAPPSGPPSALAPGDRVLARLDRADVWAPGEVREIRAGTGVYVTLDHGTDCAGQHGKAYLWAVPDSSDIIRVEN